LNTDEIIAAISHLSGPELERVREAVERRRERLAQSTIVEQRSFGSGILQLGYRTNPNMGTKRGPYWYFHYREGAGSTPSMLARPMIRRKPWLRSLLRWRQRKEEAPEC